MTFKILRFNDSTETAPAWAASTMAIKADVEGELMLDQAVVLVAANSRHEAEDKALNMALRTWRIADGWSNHRAVVTHLQTALAAWYGAVERT